MKIEDLKRALNIAIQSDIGFEGNAKDAAGLLSLITGLEARIAELEAEVTKCHELQDAYCDRIAELEGFIDRLVEASKKIYSWASFEDYTAFYALVDAWKEREE